MAASVARVSAPIRSSKVSTTSKSLAILSKNFSSSKISIRCKPCVFLQLRYSSCRLRDVGRREEGGGDFIVDPPPRRGREIGNWRASFPSVPRDDEGAIMIDKVLASRREYYAVRDNLWDKYAGKWIGYCEGRVRSLTPKNIKRSSDLWC